MQKSVPSSRGNSRRPRQGGPRVPREGDRLPPRSSARRATRRLLRQLDDLAFEGLSPRATGTSSSSRGARPRQDERRRARGLRHDRTRAASASSRALDARRRTTCSSPPEAHGRRDARRPGASSASRARGSRGAEGEIVARPRARHQARRGRPAAPRQERVARARRHPRPRPHRRSRAASTRAAPRATAARTATRPSSRSRATPSCPTRTPEGRLEAVLGTPGRARGRGREDPRARADRGGRTPTRRVRRGRGVRRRGPGGDARGPRGPDRTSRCRRSIPRTRATTTTPCGSSGRDDGGYRAWIAIADVSSYVMPGTTLDDEAKTRGCSVYLPDRAIPMLPRRSRRTSARSCPDVDAPLPVRRRELDAGGNVVDSSARARRT